MPEIGASPPNAAHPAKVLFTELQRNDEAKVPATVMIDSGERGYPEAGEATVLRCLGSLPLRALAGDKPSEEKDRMKNTCRAHPLVRGHGPHMCEVFLEPTCPFSVKAFGEPDDFLEQRGQDRITRRSAFSRAGGQGPAGLPTVQEAQRTVEKVHDANRPSATAGDHKAGGSVEPGASRMGQLL